MPTSETAAALQKAAADLTFPSESDEPWEAFAWPDAAGEPNANEVKKRSRHKGNATVEERTVDELFRPLVEEQDWFGDEEKAAAAKNRELFEAVKRLLANPKVIRVGERRIAVYVIGKAKESGWVGLKTYA